MSKDYIKIINLNFTELDIDGSSKADLSCFIYCTSLGDKPQQTNIIKNSLFANFNTVFQIPINDFKTDIITFKLMDVSKNKFLSSISIEAYKIPPGDGYKAFNLNPEPNIINGGKLEVEFQGKNDEYSDSTEPLIPPPISLSENSDPSLENLEKIFKPKPSLLMIQNDSNSKNTNKYSDYSYYSDYSNENKNENFQNSSSNTKLKSIVKEQIKINENLSNIKEYSYYSSSTSKNMSVNKLKKDVSSECDYSAKRQSKTVLHRLFLNKGQSSNVATINQKKNSDEYSYYSSDPPKNISSNPKTKNESNSYDYYSTDSPGPLYLKKESLPKNKIESNSDDFCDSYNYDSSTDSSIQSSKPIDNSSSHKYKHKSKKASQTNSKPTQSINLEVKPDQKMQLNDDPIVNQDDPISKNTNFKLKSKENKGPNKESKKVKSVVVVKRKKIASTTTTRKIIKKVDAVTLIKQSKSKPHNKSNN